jgi:hypothetical protein
MVGGPPISLASNQLFQQQGYTLTAMGSDTRVTSCAGINGGGTATAAPQTSLFLTGMQGYDLVPAGAGPVRHHASGAWGRCAVAFRR